MSAIRSITILASLVLSTLFASPALATDSCDPGELFCIDHHETGPGCEGDYGFAATRESIRIGDRDTMILIEEDDTCWVAGEAEGETHALTARYRSDDMQADLIYEDSASTSSGVESRQHDLFLESNAGTEPTAIRFMRSEGGSGSHCTYAINSAAGTRDDAFACGPALAILP